jgi:hypothetical protein
MVVTVPLKGQITLRQRDKARNFNILVEKTLEELQMYGGAIVKAALEQARKRAFSIKHICAHKVIVIDPALTLSLVRIGLADDKSAPKAAFEGALAVLVKSKKVLASGTFGQGGLTDPRNLNKDPDIVYFYQRQVRPLSDRCWSRQHRHLIIARCCTYITTVRRRKRLRQMNLVLVQAAS